MNAPDTLIIDSAHLQVWTANADYDYGREAAQASQTLLDQLWMVFMGWLDKLTSGVFDGVSDEVWTVVGVVAVVALVVFLLVRYPQLLGRHNQRLEEAEETADTIYGVDFEASIRRAVAARDWREAVRLTYLHALRRLHDGGLIDWQPYKTPTQYTREVTTAEFRTFTNHFLRIRYGGFEATEELLDTMQSLFETITRSMTGQKGGEA